MIDFHCHLLPGLDDGSNSLSESLAMARLLVEAGFTEVIATPHVMDKDGMRNEREEIVSRTDMLNRALAEAGVALVVHAGAEYHYDRPFSDMVRKYHPLSTVADSHYVLLELPMVVWPEYLSYSVMSRGSDDPAEVRRAVAFSRPVLAHPERCEEIMRDHRVLRQVREQGYLFQVNLESLVGLGGSRQQKTAHKMARENMIDFIGTDGHRASGLEKSLPKWRKKVEKILGPDQAERALVENPRRAIMNDSIDMED